MSFHVPHGLLLRKGSSSDVLPTASPLSFPPPSPTFTMLGGVPGIATPTAAIVR
jgi:hypothetical protein